MSRLPASKVRMVQVGDHPPEFAELWAIRKVAPTAIEMVILAAQFHDAVWRFNIATQNENFPSVIAACREIDDLSDKIAFLNSGLKSAMQSHEQEEYRR